MLTHHSRTKKIPKIKLTMAKFLLAVLVSGGVVHASSLSHFHGSLGNLIITKPSLLLFLIVVMFPLWKFKLSAVKIGLCKNILWRHTHWSFHIRCSLANSAYQLLQLTFPNSTKVIFVWFMCIRTVPAMFAHFLLRYKSCSCPQNFTNVITGHSFLADWGYVAV